MAASAANAGAAAIRITWAPPSQGLTPDQREVVVLRFVADLSLETVAAMTNRAEGAVKSLQHRALRNLAASLARADDVHVEARKNLAPRIERLRQRLASANVVAHVLQQPADGWRGRATAWRVRG